MGHAYVRIAKDWYKWPSVALVPEFIEKMVAEQSLSYCLEFSDTTRVRCANRSRFLLYRPSRIFSASRARSAPHVRVLAKDAGADRMRRARAASRSSHWRRESDQSRMRGFFAMSARPRCARRGRRRVRGVRDATVYVVYGVEYHIQRPRVGVR